MHTDSQKGAVRPLWLAMGVLTCVMAGAGLNKCLSCRAADEAATRDKTTSVVQGELIDSGTPQVDGDGISDPAPATNPEAAVNPTNRLATRAGMMLGSDIGFDEATYGFFDEDETPPAQEAGSRRLPTLDRINRARQAKNPVKKKKGKTTYLELTFDKLAGWVYEFPENPAQKPQRPDPVPGSLSKLTGTDVAIRGFMIPYKVEGEDVIEFLLVRNQSACCYGVVPKMNEWLHVKMAPGKKAPYALDIPVTVYGKFDAKELITDGVVMSLFRIESTEVEEPPVFR